MHVMVVGVSGMLPVLAVLVMTCAAYCCERSALTG
jgi:hypothetical protein